MLAEGEKEFLNNLYTTSGQKIRWNRRGSMSVDGISGMIDIYDTYLPFGQIYKTIYINMYGATVSTIAPAGFVLGNASLSHVNEQSKEKNHNVKYCSRCGSSIDSETKLCTGCGRQYFRWPKNNRLLVTLLSVLVVLLSVLCVTQPIRMQELQHRIEFLDEQITLKQKKIDKLEDKVEKLNLGQEELLFYQQHAVIVGDDGTNKYHKYGCPILDGTETFWIYNTEAAKSKGKKECTTCH